MSSSQCLLKATIFISTDFISIFLSIDESYALEVVCELQLFVTTHYNPNKHKSVLSHGLQPSLRRHLHLHLFLPHIAQIPFVKR